MSAYQVDRAHIATLASYAAGGTFKISRRFGDLVQIANQLAAENVESLKARYPNDEWEAHNFANENAVWNAARLELHQPLVMIKAASCLEYQSCEHEGWIASEAYDILRQIVSAAIRDLPGYDNAEGWSIDDAPAGQAPKVMSLFALSQGAYKGAA